MKKFLKRCSIFAAAAAMSTFAFSAFADSVTDLETQIEEMTAQSRVYEFNPIMPQTGESIASWDWDEYRGILVYCEAPKNIEGTFCGERLITPSQDIKAYSVEWAGQALMILEPLEEVISRLNSDYTRDVLHTEVTLANLPAEYEGKEDHLFVTYVSMQGVTYEPWVRDLLDDERLTVVGLLRAHYRQLGYYSEPALTATPAEGYTVDWDALAAEYSEIEYADAEHSSLKLKDDTPQAEAAALCEKLEAREDIASAVLWAAFLDSSDNAGATGAEVVALLHYGTGDLNTSGALELADAILLARAVGGTYQLSAEGRAEADLNADGEINSADLTALLERLSGK